MQQIETMHMVNTWMVLKRKLLVSICGHKQSTELLVAGEPAYESQLELEDEVTSVQDEEVPADLDSQQEPKDLVDGEFDLAYLELASSTARLSRMHMVAATLSFTLRIVNVPRVSASVIIRRKA